MTADRENGGAELRGEESRARAREGWLVGDRQIKEHSQPPAMNTKLAGKPISSPGRAEKYPPPFMMRFLRTNVGSRSSRGRSRTSPMFLRKRNVAVDTQEPSSPKVTCMGQVRAKQSARKPASTTRRRCRWIRRALLCHCHRLLSKSKPKPAKSSWGKWVVFFHCGFRKEEKVSEDSSGFGSKLRTGFEYSGHGNGGDASEEDEEMEEAKVSVSSWSRSPPRNALLLTRCRSAPYRSSSLAYRFWGSPPLEKEGEGRAELEDDAECERPASEAEPVCRDSDRESRTDPETEEKLSLFKEVEGKSGAEEEELARFRPLTLTRCKSEPARTGAKLDPELSYWRKRRLGVT